MDTTIIAHSASIGPMAGTIIGLLGGIIGTYFSLRKANSKREKKWILTFAVGIVVAIAVFLHLFLTSSQQTKVILLLGYVVIYPILLFIGIKFINRLHKKQE